MPLAFPASAHRAGLGMLAALLLAGSASAEPAVVKSVKPGDGLYEVVVGNGRVYVASAGSRGENNGAILALDPKTLEVKETFQLGAEPGYGLGINTRTRTLYATQTRSGRLAAIDLATGKVAATIGEGEKPHVREAVVDEGANRVYVSVTGRRDTPSAIWVVDGAANKLIATIADLKGSVSGIALDAKGQRLFASAMETNEIHEIDLKTNKLARSFPSGGKNAINLAYDAAGDRLFVAHQESGDLTVLNARDGTLVKTIPTGEGALGVSFDAKRNLVYVANRRAGFVTLIDAVKLEPVANVVTGSMPNTVVVDAETGSAYVTNKVKSAGRPRPPEGAAPGGTPPKPVPMIDPNGDTVTLITP